MAFRLRMTFAGMCMLVRDPERADGRKMLHVLMPPVGHHRHVVRLVYARQLQVPNAHPKQLTHVMLDNQDIDLSDLIQNSSATSVELDKDVFDMGLLGARPLERAFFEANHTFDKVLSRVHVAAGAYAEHVPGGVWTIQKASGAQVGPQRMATSVQWLIEDVPGDSLTLNLTGINGKANGPKLVLTPTETMPEIHLLILNVVEQEVPHFDLKLPPPVNPPIKGSEAKHFGAFYTLWGDSVKAENPKFEEIGPLPEHTLSARESAGSELTCMVATTLAQPPG